jgi:molybdate transport system substrate-binding protein
MNSHIWRTLVVTALLSSGALAPAPAAELKVLTAGAFKQVVVALVPAYERQTGNTVVVDNDTAGGLKTKIEGGAAFDVAVITPAVLKELTSSGKIAGGTSVNVASVGVGVVAAKSVAYIDPASGGSSGIYIDKLLERLGIADQVRPKAKLKKGGHVADLIVSGEAELGLHQISEIVPVKGVALVGPLPKEIQNTTTYAAGLSASTQNKAAAQALMQVFSGAEAAAVLKSKGMEPAN